MTTVADIVAESQRITGILQGYQICDCNRLEQIAEFVGVPQNFLMNDYFDDKNLSMEDIQIVLEAIQATADTVELAEANALTFHVTKSSLENLKLSSELYTRIAELLSLYSEHCNTKTVKFRKGKMKISPVDAYESSSKDTYNDNGIVAKSYYNLVSYIVDVSRDKKNEQYLTVLSKLYRTITTLSEDACNQQNAFDIALVLEQFNPVE